VADLAGRSETADSVAFPVRQSEIREVLGTGVFSGRGEQRLGPAHRTYAEFLAAWYLSQRGLTLKQKMALLRHPQDASGRIVPQLAETAAWLAGMHTDVFRTILESDPQVLLRSDVAKATPKDREALVDSLLRLFDAEKVNDSDWGLRGTYRNLKHPGLAGQIEPYIRDASKGTLVRRFAIDVAEACEEQSLQGLLADVALDAAADTHIREQAAYAVARIGDEATLRRLKPLALGSAGEDPRDELKGIVLRALWPRLLSAEELFANLTLPRNKSFFGEYSRFVARELIEGLREDDLPQALQWCSNLRRLADLPLQFRDLMEGVLLRAWQRLSNPSVLQSMVPVVVSALEHHDDMFDGIAAKLRPHGDTRRDLVAKVVPLIADLGDSCCWQLCGSDAMVWPDDLPWLIGRLEQETDDRLAARWAKLIRGVFDPALPDHLDAVVQAAEGNAHLGREFADLLTPMDLNSPQAEQLRREYQEGQRSRREMRAKRTRPPLDPPPKVCMERWLGRCEAGDADAWWRLNREMQLDDNSTHYRHDLEADLTALPGWKNGDPHTRARIVAAAKRFVTSRKSRPDKWLGTNTIHYPDLAGYRALLLLSAEAPDYVGALPREVWANWAPIIIGYPAPIGARGEEERHLDLIAAAYRQAPQPIVETLVALIDKENSDGEHLYVLRKVSKCWDDYLRAALLTKAQDKALKASCLGDLLADLIGHGCAEAEAYAGSLVPDPLPAEEAAHARAREAAVALVTCADDAGWSTLWPAIKADADFGREVLTQVASSPRERYGSFTPKLPEDAAADLFLWLHRQFPPEEDPKREGTHCVGSRGSVADLRDALLRLLQSRGTPEACRAIARIAQDLPHVKWLKWAHVEAEKNMLQSTWVPLEPRHFLAFTEHGGTRLVRLPEDLFEVLIESLEDLQVKLQGETPAVADLWNKVAAKKYRPKEENHLSDYVKRHLDADLRRRGMVTLREVEIRRPQGNAPGERTDIHVTAVVEGVAPGTLDRVRVIIEVKGCWHKELKIAMESQLVGRYLKDNDCRHGLYLVGWYQCPQWEKNDPRRKKTPTWTIDKAREFFEKQAAGLSKEGLVVRAFVLNAALR
jgi:hypothetical protein